MSPDRGAASRTATPDGALTAGVPAATAAPATTPAAAPQGTATSSVARGPRRGARAARRGSGRRRTTPELLRRLGALGLLAGVLTGATTFAAAQATSDALDTARESGAAQLWADAARADLASARAYASVPSGATGADPAEAASPLTTQSFVDLTRAAAARGDAGGEHAAAAQAVAGFSHAATRPAQAGQDATRIRAVGDTGQSADQALAGLSDADRRDVESSRTRLLIAGWGAGIVGGAATLGLAGGMVWLARKTHRVINPPLLMGTVLVAGATLAAVATSVSAAGAWTGAHDDRASWATTTTMQRLAADARLDELTAAAGGGTIDAGAWDAAQTAAEPIADPEFTRRWEAYAAAHESTANALGAGRSASARSAAAGGQGAFAEVTRYLDEHSASPPDGPPSGATAALPWLLLVAGVAGGAAALAGASRRLREYR